MEWHSFDTSWLHTASTKVTPAVLDFSADNFEFDKNTILKEEIRWENVFSNLKNCSEFFRFI